ncbi:MAG: glycoside hydrolase family 36 N-terminal domain-containing protein, partial [Bacilli bacterium]
MIKYDSKNKVFSLSNKKITYAFMVDHLGILIHLYYGSVIKDPSSLPKYSRFIERGTNTSPILGDNAYSYDYLLQEYPVFNHGDYAYPALHLKGAKGSYVSHFKYKSYEITSDPIIIEGLPSFSNDQALSLIITLEDNIMQAQLKLYYTIYQDHAAITRSAQLINLSTNDIEIEKMMSSSFALASDQYQLIHLSGSWAN